MSGEYSLQVLGDTDARHKAKLRGEALIHMLSAMRAGGCGIVLFVRPMKQSKQRRPEMSHLWTFLGCIRTKKRLFCFCSIGGGGYIGSAFRTLAFHPL